MEADDDRTNALQALRATEIRMGRAVDSLVGDLRISYTRAAQLLATPVAELNTYDTSLPKGTLRAINQKLRPPRPRRQPAAPRS